MPEYNRSSTEVASSPASSSPNTFVPQFSTAEYGKAPSTRCRLCSHFIYSQYFKVNGQKVCPTCAEQARSGQSTDSHGSLMGALLFGIGGAILGMIFYSAVMMATGWTIGYLALAVGWIIGKAVLAGARGVGSVRIQILAILLTYAAISLSALPAILYHAYSHLDSVADWLTFLVGVVPSGLASPFKHLDTNPINAGLGLVILLIGLRIAWRLTCAKPLAVAGPFDITPA
jgi:hypothetical protein